MSEKIEQGDVVEVSVKTLTTLKELLKAERSDDYADYLNTQWRIYVSKLCEEKESLIARFMNEHKHLKPSDICIVEKITQTGRVFYPDLKVNHEQKP